MDEGSPAKNKGTSSRVIDSLHSTIDQLKQELETSRGAHDDYRKKYALAAQKNDSFVDQLANAKHENDMVHALLKRKERRISDLEDQYNDLSSETETLRHNFKNIKIRCENLQESSSSSTAEFERLKIAYDALLASQTEYKRHYSQEVQSLAAQLRQYRHDNDAQMQSLAQQFASNDKDVDTLLDGLTNKRRSLETLYVSKNKAVLDLLGKLARATKLHGAESKSLLVEVVEVVEALLQKYPDLPDKIHQHEHIEVDVSEILNESNDTLAANCSFDEESTLVDSPDLASEPKMRSLSQTLPPAPHNAPNQRRRKNKRSSMRIDSGEVDFSRITTPVGQPQLSVPKRSFHIKAPDQRSRTPTPPGTQRPPRKSSTTHNGHSNNPATHNSSGTNGNTKPKRRSMYGNGGYNYRSSSEHEWPVNH
ncbi:SWI5-dependent HO expression protein 3 [[Candida] zeylanoides]